MLGRIDNLDIYCSSVAEMASFYHDVLRLPYFLPYQPGAGWVAFDAGNMTIYMFETGGSHPPIRTPVTEENPPGIDSFAFEVENLDQAVTELNDHVRWASDSEERWAYEGEVWYRYRTFYDPEGNMIHITEPHRA
jgi:hypothetical protein